MTRRSALLLVAGSSAVLAAVLLVGHVTGVCYYEHGGQFSPDTFRDRSYQACVLGPIRIPWYGQERDSPVSRYLRSNGYIESASGDVRWFHTVGTQVGWFDLVCSFGSPVGRLSTDFDGDLGERLVTWSERRPDLAKAFWPTVVKWTQKGRCADAASLLEEFERRSDPESEEEAQKIVDRAVVRTGEDYGAYRLHSE